MKVTLNNTIGAGFLGSVGASMCVCFSFPIPQELKGFGVEVSMESRSCRYTCIIWPIRRTGYFKRLRCVSQSIWWFSLDFLCFSNRSLPYCKRFPSLTRCSAWLNFRRYRALDTFHLIITTVVIYHYCIDEYGHPAALQGVVWYVKHISSLSVPHTQTDILVFKGASRWVYLLSYPSLAPNSINSSASSTSECTFIGAGSRTDFWLLVLT